MTVESGIRPAVAPGAPETRDPTVYPTPFSQRLREATSLLPEGLSRLSAGGRFSPEECFADPVALVMGGRFDPRLIAALAEATGGGVLVSLSRTLPDSGAGFGPSLLQCLPGARIEYAMPLAPEQLWPHRAPWDRDAPARLMIIAWQGEGHQAHDAPRRLALIVAQAAAGPAVLPGEEPSFPVYALALDDRERDAPAGVPSEASAMAEALGRWSRPPRFLLRPGTQGEALSGYAPVARLADPPLLLYELRRSAASLPGSSAADGAMLMKASPRMAGTAPAARPDAIVSAAPEVVSPPPVARAVRLENWSALNLDEGMRLLFQPERTPLEGGSLQQFLMAVQRAYAEARLMIGTAAPVPVKAAPRSQDPTDGVEMRYEAPRAAAGAASGKEADDYGLRPSYTGRLREQIARMGLMHRLEDLRGRLQSRADLGGLKFHEPSDAVPQDPSVLIGIPGMPGVMLSIKARLSGKGVNLLVVPSDRRAVTKAAFETLMTSGLRQPFTVQTGGIHGKYAHCVVPQPGAPTGSRSVSFDYGQVDDIARALRETLTRLHDQGPPHTTMHL
jgi:hypothetical protein